MTLLIIMVLVIIFIWFKTKNKPQCHNCDSKDTYILYENPYTVQFYCWNCNTISINPIDDWIRKYKEQQ